MGSVLVRAMSRHMEKGLAPRRVISRRARPPTSLSSGASPTSSWKQRAEGGGRELGQMADPGDHLVVTGGVDVDDARTHGGDERAPFVRRALRRAGSAARLGHR